MASGANRAGNGFVASKSAPGLSGGTGVPLNHVVYGPRDHPVACRLPSQGPRGSKSRRICFSAISMTLLTAFSACPGAESTLSRVWGRAESAKQMWFHVT